MTMKLAGFRDYALGEEGRAVGRGTAIHLQQDTVTGQLGFHSDSGDRRWIIHSETNKIKNNEIRNQFLNAISRETHVEVKDFPPALKAALRLDDFGLVEGKVKSGKPLTAYRMRQVFQALDSQEVKDALAKARGRTLYQLHTSILSYTAGITILKNEGANIGTCISDGVFSMVGACSSEGRLSDKERINLFIQGKKKAWCQSGLNSMTDFGGSKALYCNGQDVAWMSTMDYLAVNKTLNELEDIFKQTLSEENLNDLEEQLRTLSEEKLNDLEEQLRNLDSGRQ